MATKKNAKATKAVAKGTAVVAKATKAKKAKVEVVPTDEVVMDAKADITAVEGMVECTSCKANLEQTSENFSPMAKGGFRSICKPCQSKKSGEWTGKRADYRKQYQRARQLIDKGIPVIVPDAKTWAEGDVLMTIPYERDGVEYPSVPAEGVYAEMKAKEAEQRAELKAERDAQKAEILEQRKAERAKLREQKAQEKADLKAQKDAERAKIREQKAQERAEKAEQAKKEREQKAIERAEQRKIANAEKAEQARLAREQKAVERAELAKQKALAKAEANAKKAEAKKQEILAKTAKA